MLGDKHPGARHFTANRRTLDHPQQQQRQRRPDDDLRVGRQQAHQQGRHRHHENAQGEHLLAPQQVTEVSHDDAAQRPRQVAGGEDAEGLQLAQPFRHVRREKQLADHGGEEHENDEIVELQRAAKGRQRQGFIIATVQRAGCWGLQSMGGGHGLLVGGFLLGGGTIANWPAA